MRELRRWVGMEEPVGPRRIGPYRSFSTQQPLDAPSTRQAQSLLNAPDNTTVRGLRDRAIIAVLLGCGLRRSEVAALPTAHVQQRDGRWCIVDLRGKHGRIRTVPMPTWVKVAIDSWTAATGVA